MVKDIHIRKSDLSLLLALLTTHTSATFQKKICDLRGKCLLPEKKLSIPFLQSTPMLLSQLKYSVAPGLLAALIYLNSLSGDLVHDDVFAIRDNEDIRPSSPFSNLLWNDFWGESMASPTSHKSYRPLTVLSFRLNYMWHGLEPWGYHLVNVALHVMTTVLLGWFCRIEVFASDEGGSAGWWSLVVMLLFASHPIHTEAVGAPTKFPPYTHKTFSSFPPLLYFLLLLLLISLSSLVFSLPLDPPPLLGFSLPASFPTPTLVFAFFLNFTPPSLDFPSLLGFSPSLLFQVSGVVGRADVLACLLFLTSLLLYCSSTRCTSQTAMLIKVIKSIFTHP